MLLSDSRSVALLIPLVIYVNANAFTQSSGSAVVGLVRIELTTSSLSVTRSNRLSYSPAGVPIYTRPQGALEARGVKEF